MIMDVFDVWKAIAELHNDKFVVAHKGTVFESVFIFKNGELTQVNQNGPKPIDFMHMVTFFEKDKFTTVEKSAPAQPKCEKCGDTGTAMNPRENIGPYCECPCQEKKTSSTRTMWQPVAETNGKQLWPTIPLYSDKNDTTDFYGRRIVGWISVEVELND